MQIDLHSHTTASDGALSPAQLLGAAEAAGVKTLAITDHDTVAGLDELLVGSGLDDYAIELVAGIEFSSRWHKLAIHVVGLNIDMNCIELRDAINLQQLARQQRGEEIARRLAKLGYTNAYEGARQFATGQQLGRHGRVGDVKNCWPELAEVIGWIKKAKGVAVLAHPIDYKLTRTRLRALVADFAAAGGEAIEIALPQVDSQTMQQLAELASEFGLAASTGSDFHALDRPWRQLGQAPALPEQCVPVWTLWS
jgi:predicted metal-dependent phosphoesterase TrpH